METRRHLFLDLEDTVITPVMDGWHLTELIPEHIARVKHVIKTFRPDQVHIFSFAIWNKEELRKFNNGTRPMLEEAIGFQLSAVPTVDDDIVPICCDIKNLNKHTVDFQECSNFWGKHEAFRLNARHMFRKNWSNWEIETEVIFLDDAVWDENFEWPDLHVKGKILNIDNMPKV